MKKELIFIGGARGVGKSTIIKEANEILKLPVLYTGKIYKEAIEKNIEPEQSIYKNIMTHKGFVDTHYAGKNGNKFKRNIKKENLINIAHKRDEIKFVLIDLNLEELLERRKKDNYKNRKIRNLSIDETLEELELNKEYFNKYIQETGKEGFIINNKDYLFYSNLNTIKKIGGM